MTGNFLRVLASGELVHLLDSGELAEAAYQATGIAGSWLTYLIAGNLLRLPIRSSASGELVEATYSCQGVNLLT
jgi:hypothetical protein